MACIHCGNCIVVQIWVLTSLANLLGILILDRVVDVDTSANSSVVIAIIIVIICTFFAVG